MRWLPSALATHTTPPQVEAACGEVRRELLSADGSFSEAQLGVHCHDDCGLAVANMLAAVRGGATMLQGTLNGLGERCGNANLATLAATLSLKARAMRAAGEAGNV